LRCCRSRCSATRPARLKSNELAAEWVKENLGEFEPERTEVIAGEVMVSRAASEVLEPAHH